VSASRARLCDAHAGDLWMAGSEDRACQWHQGCNLKRSGEFGVSPFCGQQLPASKERDGAGRLHGSRNHAYGCFGSESQRMSAPNAASSMARTVSWWWR